MYPALKASTLPSSMATYRARFFLPTAAGFADAPGLLRLAVCAFAFCATAASAQLTGMKPTSLLLQNAVINKPYSVTFSSIPANPGFGLFWFTGEGGCFNGSGLTFNGGSGNTASISGTPTAVGTYTCSVTVEAEDPGFITQTYTLHVVKACAPPQITSGDPPAATAGVPYSFTVTATGKAPLTFAAMGLPTGLSIDPASGAITGTTNATGNHAVAVMVTACGRTALQDFTLVVNVPPPAMVALSLTSEPNPSIFGQPVTAVAHATDGSVAPTGSVLLCLIVAGQFCAAPVGAPPAGTDASLIPPLLSAPLDANGNATFTLDGLLIQNYMLQAYYGGDAVHNSATAGPVDQFVIKGLLFPPTHAALRPRAAQQDPPAATPIPTLSWSALGLLALAMAGIVAVQLRRRPRGR
jgi:hypothetical protein